MLSHETRYETDVFDVEKDRRYCQELTAMVLTTQLVGLVLIGFGLGLLEGLPRTAFKVIASGGVGLLFLGAWSAYCWYDSVNLITGFSDNTRAFTPVAPATRKTRLLRGTLALIVVDSLLLSVLIVMTGGPGRSPLDPLLPTIPIIAIILRQPRRTILTALAMGFVVIGLFVFHWSADALQIQHASLHQLQKWVHDCHTDRRYPLAFGVVAFGAIAMSLGEFFVTHQRPALAKNVGEAVDVVLPPEDERFRGIKRSIKRGAKTWVKWLAHRDLPMADLSVVHDEQDVIKQAVILIIPYWLADGGIWFRRRTRKRIARHVTLLTLAAHWIDDHFDALEHYCTNPKTRNEILNSEPEILLKGQHPRLKEVVKRMNRSVERRNRHLVSKAVIRIMYGGLVQNARSSERLIHLRRKYFHFVSQNLFGNQKQVYRDLCSGNHPHIIMLTAKVVMELLDSCTANPVTKQSEFFCLLYAPILHYHNWQHERDIEKYGEGFTEEILKQLPDDAALTRLIEKCQTLIPECFGPSGLPEGRCIQLQALLNLYDPMLPQEIKDAYTKILASELRRRQRIEADGDDPAKEQ